MEEEGIGGGAVAQQKYEEKEEMKEKGMKETAEPN